MIRSEEIKKMEKKLAKRLREIDNLEDVIYCRTHTMSMKEFTAAHTKLNNLRSDTWLMERKLKNLRAGHPALGYAESEHTVGHFMNINQTVR